ncbi:MAG: GspH/FimT family pseudopilin [Planctomycetes bacterium]|nr:GspH/FimT family pseudopilin [Planctomycetota bacterium]
MRSATSSLVHTCGPPLTKGGLGGVERRLARQKHGACWSGATPPHPPLVRGGIQWVRGGFTLLEALAVIAVLGIAAALVIPSAGGGDAQGLEAAASILAADLRLARGQAVQTGSEWTLTLDVSGRAWEIVHTGSGNPPPLKNPLAPAAKRDDRYRTELAQFDGLTGGRIELAGASLATSGRSVADVTFMPLGGTGPARTEDTLIWLTSGSGLEVRVIEVRVSWLTGQVWTGPVTMLGGFAQKRGLSPYHLRIANRRRDTMKGTVPFFGQSSEEPARSAQWGQRSFR